MHVFSSKSTVFVRLLRNKQTGLMTLAVL